MEHKAVTTDLRFLTYKQVCIIAMLSLIGNIVFLAAWGLK